MAETAALITLTVGVITATAAVCQIVQCQPHVASDIRILSRKCLYRRTVVIEEFDGKEMKNKHYEAAEIYLANKFPQSLKDDRVRVGNEFSIRMPRNGKVKDIYGGRKFKWVWSPSDPNNHNTDNMRSFELVFSKKIEENELKSYLNYVMEEARKFAKIKSY